MQAGKLRHYVGLQSSTATQDSFGEPIDDYDTYESVWASVEPLTGRELLLAQQVNAEITLRVKMRYNASVKPTDRISFGSRTIEVVSVMNLEERGRELEMLCKELV